MNKSIVDKIIKLKKKKNAIILAHNYQPPEIQDIGDYVGDSLGLCQKAAETNADIIIFCGVWFMAESASLLNPDKMVILPEKQAGCPMADMVTFSGLKEQKEKHPLAKVVCYINTNAKVKALSDIACTSSNAEKIIASIPANNEIIFIPDKYLGGYIADKTKRNMILWPGFCPVHKRILPEHIEKKKTQYPDAMVLVHPECSKEVIDLADMAGSTSQILKYCNKSDKKTFIIGTENGILHSLKKNNPDKLFIPSSDLAVCENMKKITLGKVLYSLESLSPVVTVNLDIREKALKPIEKMLELS